MSIEEIALWILFIGAGVVTAAMVAFMWMTDDYDTHLRIDPTESERAYRKIKDLNPKRKSGK